MPGHTDGKKDHHCYIFCRFQSWRTPCLTFWGVFKELFVATYNGIIEIFWLFAADIRGGTGVKPFFGWIKVETPGLKWIEVIFYFFCWFLSFLGSNQSGKTVVHQEVNCNLLAPLAQPSACFVRKRTWLCDDQPFLFAYFKQLQQIYSIRISIRTFFVIKMQCVV